MASTVDAGERAAAMPVVLAGAVGRVGRIAAAQQKVSAEGVARAVIRADHPENGSNVRKARRLPVTAEGHVIG